MKKSDLLFHALNEQQKRQLSKDPNRDPRKSAKDIAQADRVQALVKEYLPHLALPSKRP